MDKTNKSVSHNQIYSLKKKLSIYYHMLGICVIVKYVLGNRNNAINMILSS